MAADQTLQALASQAAPLDYPVPGAVELILKSLKCSFDGTSAAGAYVPCVQLLIAGDVEDATYPLGSSVAAGASADVSWFPGIGGGAGGIPVINVVDLVAFNPVSGFVPVTGTTEGTSTTIITSNPVTYDGATQVMVAFQAADVTQDQRGKTGLAAVIFALYRDSSFLGAIVDYNVNPGDYGVSPLYVSAVDTPPAGSHTYSINAWHEVASGTLGACQVDAGSGIFGTDTYPGYLLISKLAGS